jgi:hypothetical protein
VRALQLRACKKEAASKAKKLAKVNGFLNCVCVKGLLIDVSANEERFCIHGLWTGSYNIFLGSRGEILVSVDNLESLFESIPFFVLSKSTADPEDYFVATVGVHIAMSKTPTLIGCEIVPYDNFTKYKLLFFFFPQCVSIKGCRCEDRRFLLYPKLRHNSTISTQTSFPELKPGLFLECELEKAIK